MSFKSREARKKFYSLGFRRKTIRPRGTMVARRFGLASGSRNLRVAHLIDGKQEIFVALRSDAKLFGMPVTLGDFCKIFPRENIHRVRDARIVGSSRSTE